MTTSLAPEKCPACGERIKAGLYGGNGLLETDKNQVINHYHTKLPQRCNRCGDALYEDCRFKLRQEKDSLVQQIARYLPAIPIVSLQSPMNWEYTVLGLVTAQSVTGTGFYAEFVSSYTDLFGSQSKTYNKKIRDGEDLCQGMLRKKAFDLGGNAVLATDIDYAEVGGAKGMLMVCMTGTAVVLKNPEAINEKSEEWFVYLRNLRSKYNEIINL